MSFKIEVTDQPVNYRPGSNGLNSVWGLTIDGKRVGTVWETENDKYAGRIEGTTAAGETRDYTCPEVAYRQTVIDQLAEMAERIGIVRMTDKKPDTYTAQWASPTKTQGEWRDVVTRTDHATAKRAYADKGKARLHSRIVVHTPGQADYTLEEQGPFNGPITKG